MSETEHHEKVLAFAWHCGTFTKEQAIHASEVRSLNFTNVQQEKTRLEILDA